MSEGKSFYIHAPATGKARHPTVENLRQEHTGTNRLSVVEDRSLCRHRVSAMRKLRMNCRRYSGALACS